ncbi:sigma-70 family RNA polymerase sigma factor [bacterium]|nr:sigma-70 family RNA polymerase sigma factor [bacterium]
MLVSELEQFYEVHVEKIYRYFFYKVLNREIAEDLTSQTFLKFTKKNTGDAVNDPKNFVYGIAKHILLDYLRSKYKKLEQPLPEEDDLPDVENDEPEVHILDHLEHVLPNIPEKQAVVLRMRFLDKLSLSEIALKLGKDVNYVSTTQKRAFQSIKKFLECTDGTTTIVR